MRRALIDELVRRRSQTLTPTARAAVRLQARRPSAHELAARALRPLAAPGSPPTGERCSSSHQATRSRDDDTDRTVKAFMPAITRWV